MPRTETDIAIVDEEQREDRRRRDGASRRVQVSNHVDRVPAQADLQQPRDRGVRSRAARTHARDARCWYTVPADAVERAGIARAGCSERFTPRSTGSSACCRCSRSATGGTSAGCRWRSTRRPDEPTIFVYDGYPGGAGIAELAFDAAARHAALRSISSPRARATTGARRACSRRSAATGTSTSTRAARSPCSASWRAAVRVTAAASTTAARASCAPGRDTTTTSADPVAARSTRPGAPPLSDAAACAAATAADELIPSASASAPRRARRRRPPCRRSREDRLPRRHARRRDTARPRAPTPATMSTLTLPRLINHFSARIVARACSTTSGNNGPMSGRSCGRGTATTVTGSPTPPDRCTSTVTPGNARRAASRTRFLAAPTLASRTAAGRVLNEQLVARTSAVCTRASSSITSTGGTSAAHTLACPRGPGPAEPRPERCHGMTLSITASNRRDIAWLFVAHARTSPATAAAASITSVHRRWSARGRLGRSGRQARRRDATRVRTRGSPLCRDGQVRSPPNTTERDGEQRKGRQDAGDEGKQQANGDRAGAGLGPAPEIGAHVAREPLRARAWRARRAGSSWRARQRAAGGPVPCARGL